MNDDTSSVPPPPTEAHPPIGPDDRRRDGTADLLKGVAVLLMVWVHLIEKFAHPAVFASTVGRVSLLLGGPPVAPVYLVVLGWFLARSHRDARGLVLRGFGLLAVAVLLNVGLNAHVLIRIGLGHFAFDPRVFLLGVDVLFVAGFAVLIVAGLRPLSGATSWPWFLLAAIVAAASTAVPAWGLDLNAALTTDGPWRWGLAFVGGRYAWSYFPLIPWLAYPLIGVGVARMCAGGDSEGEHFPTRTDLTIALPVVSLVIATTFGFAYGVATNLDRYYHHGPAFVVWTCCFLLVWTVGWRGVESRWGRTGIAGWLKRLGRHVTGCYILQWLIIGNIATSLYRSETLLHCGLWWVFIVAVLSQFTALLGRMEGPRELPP